MQKMNKVLELWKGKTTEDEVISLVKIGFCQPIFYKANIWKKAKDFFNEVLVPNELAYAFDFGRGKGKFDSQFDIEHVQQQALMLIHGEKS
jgi:hypothetical protein